MLLIDSAFKYAYNLCMGTNAVIVIPARFGSTRFPGKILAPILGKPMIWYVYRGALQSTMANEIIVATDSEKIKETVEAFGGKAVLTKGNFPSGTDRVFEAVKDKVYDIVVNLQGDEPLIKGEILDLLIQELINSNADITTPCYAADESEAQNPNRVKIVTDSMGYALYFSRSPIPYYRNNNGSKEYLIHIGIYAYKFHSLKKFVKLPSSELENKEKLEQLRALEYGMKIKVVKTNYRSYSVDIPEDIKVVENLLKNKEAL